jgi:hypothetical protein
MNRATTIEVVCAWCRKPVGRKAGHGVRGVSHTICPDCLPNVLKEYRDSKRARWREGRVEHVAL